MNGWWLNDCVKSAHSTVLYCSHIQNSINIPDAFRLTCLLVRLSILAAAERMLLVIFFFFFLNEIRDKKRKKCEKVSLSK